MNPASTQSPRSTPPTPPSLWTTLRRFPKPVWIVFAGMFINRFGTFVVPFLALHLIHLGYSVKQAGLAVGAYGAGHLLASIVGGHLADTLGRRKTIVLSMFSSAAAILTLSQVSELWAFIVVAAIAGLTAEVYRPAGSALLSDCVADEDRLTAFATYRFAINLGWAFGPATAGWVVRYSYFWLFAIDAMTSVVFGVIAWRCLKETLVRPSKDWRRIGDAFAGMRTALRTAFQDARFVQLALSCLAIALVFMQMFSTFGLEVKSNGFSEQTYGLLLALNGVWIVLFEIPLTAWTRRFDARRVIAFGFALIGASMALLCVANTVRGYALAMTVFTFGEMISMPMTLALVSRLAPADMRGRYMGVFGLTWASAIMLGPSLGMWAYSADRIAFWLGCGLLAFASTAIILARPAREKVPSVLAPALKS